MRKAYVASSTKNMENVREVQDLLTERGVDITFDWTVVVADVGDLSDYGSAEREEMRKTAAYNDLQGVLEADILILLCHPQMFGALIEFGMAAVSEEKDLIIVGAPHRDSVFFALDGVTRLRDVVALEDHLESRYGLLPLPENA